MLLLFYDYLTYTFKFYAMTLTIYIEYYYLCITKGKHFTL